MAQKWQQRGTKETETEGRCPLRAEVNAPLIRLLTDFHNSILGTAVPNEFQMESKAKRERGSPYTWGCSQVYRNAAAHHE